MNDSTIKIEGDYYYYVNQIINKSTNCHYLIILISWCVCWRVTLLTTFMIENRQWPQHHIYMIRTSFIEGWTVTLAQWNLSAWTHMHTLLDTHFPYALTLALCQCQLLHRSQSPTEAPSGAYSAFHGGVSAAPNPYGWKKKSVYVPHYLPGRSTSLRASSEVFCASSTKTWERLVKQTSWLLWNTLSQIPWAALFH